MTCLARLQYINVLHKKFIYILTMNNWELKRMIPLKIALKTLNS